MPRKVYVVRSAETEPVFYAAVQNFGEAQRIIDHLEQNDPNGAFDYEVVPIYEGLEELLAHSDNGEGY